MTLVIWKVDFECAIDVSIYETQKQQVEVFCKKRLFLEISQISQENTCARAAFLTKLQASVLQLY